MSKHREDGVRASERLRAGGSMATQSHEKPNAQRPLGWLALEITFVSVLVFFWL